MSTSTHHTDLKSTTPRHQTPPQTALADRVCDHLEGKMPEGAHPSAYLSPDETGLLDQARGERTSRLQDPVHRASIVLRALGEGRSVDLDLTGKGNAQPVCLGETPTGKSMLCIEAVRGGEKVLLSVDDIGVGGFIDACGRMSEADVIAVSAGNVLRQQSNRRQS
jgi:hypothetical protein